MLKRLVCAIIILIAPALYARNNSDQKVTWINVCVHGTALSSTTILSLPSVFNGSVGGTLYSKVQSFLRKKSIFYKRRFMSVEGLKSEYDLKRNHADSFVAITLIDLYKHFLKEAGEDVSHHLFYTYGWSGLLGQTARRIAAVRLYNELCSKVIELQKQGKIVKIRIISHSHGGNVVANLAAVFYALQYTLIHDIQMRMSVNDMAFLFGSKKLVKKQLEDGFAAYKTPSHLLSHIDELIMYAPPIQPETECLFFSGFFKKVYHFYSDNDAIQVADLASTKARKSRRRIDFKQFPKSTVDVKQCRFIIERDKVPSFISAKEKVNYQVNVTARGGNPFYPFPKDPTHADFWLVGWMKDDVFYDPLPLVVFTPIFLKLFAENGHDKKDTDLHVTYDNNVARFILLDYNGSRSVALQTFPLKKIKEKCFELRKKEKEL